jgi:integrase
MQHQTALARVLPVLGDRPIDTIAAADIAAFVVGLDDAGKARESIRKSVTAIAMVLDFAGISPNPARDRVQVRLPREEPVEPEPPSAEHVEAVGGMLAVPYLLGLLVLDATGVRVGELEAAKLGDLDEQRKAWLVRAAISKTRRPRWVSLPDDLFDVIVARLPAREDRDPSMALFNEVTADRLRMAITRAFAWRRSLETSFRGRAAQASPAALWRRSWSPSGGTPSGLRPAPLAAVCTARRTLRRPGDLPVRVWKTTASRLMEPRPLSAPSGGRPARRARTAGWKVRRRRPPPCKEATGTGTAAETSTAVVEGFTLGGCDVDIAVTSRRR